eukprot:2053594-Pleurochrysis_carterae.AAC.2
MQLSHQWSLLFSHSMPRFLPTTLLSLDRFGVTVDDEIRRHCRCQADKMMTLPGRHNTWQRPNAVSPQPQGNGGGD